MIASVPTAETRPKWLECRAADRYSAPVGSGTVLVQFAETPEVVWVFSGRLPKTVSEAREMVRCQTTES